MVEYETTAEPDTKHWTTIIENEALPRTTQTKVETGMYNAEQLKADIKRLNAQATALKMDLHDLAEDLPTGWEKILEVANKAYEAYQSLTAARKQLAEMDK